MDIDHTFSGWLLRSGDHRNSVPIIDSRKMTVEAMALIHEMSLASIDGAIRSGAPIAVMIDGAFLSGVHLGFLFREYLAQMEELPL